MIEDLDPVIHAPKRLAAMAMLANAGSVSFAFLRERLVVSDSDLSKQMSALERAGYVAVTKTTRGRGGSTTYRITGQGRRAYARHRTALETILAAMPDGGPDAGPATNTEIGPEIGAAISPGRP